MIKREHHERMFILHGTMETLTAADGKGRSFTQILSSVCKENGGAVDILEIEKYVLKLFALSGLENPTSTSTSVISQSVSHNSVRPSVDQLPTADKLSLCDPSIPFPF